MKTAEVRNVTWKMNDDVYAWHRRLNSFEVGDNSIWNWHPIIGSEMASFIYLCMEREPKCFIDIGAHCGVFSSVYCSLVDNHQCYSIEPVKEHMDRLEDTAKLNEWNLTTHKIGLNNYVGKTYYHNTHMAMFVDNADYVVPDEIVSGVNENTIINEVLVDTLDNFVKTNNITPSLIKIDVEGHEGYVLMGAKDLLSKGIPVVIEIWPYGIFRTSMSKKHFLEIANNIWSHFLIWRSVKFVQYPISTLGIYFDEISIDKDAADNVIYI